MNQVVLAVISASVSTKLLPWKPGSGEGWAISPRAVESGGGGKGEVGEVEGSQQAACQRAKVMT